MGVENEECTNVCEHGDHPAPDGQRFCSRECQECEHTDCSERDDGEDNCAGVCGLDTPSPT